MSIKGYRVPAFIIILIAAIMILIERNMEFQCTPAMSVQNLKKHALGKSSQLFIISLPSHCASDWWTIFWITHLEWDSMWIGYSYVDSFHLHYAHKYTRASFAEHLRVNPNSKFISQVDSLTLIHKQHVMWHGKSDIYTCITLKCIQPYNNSPSCCIL